MNLESLKFTTQKRTGPPYQATNILICYINLVIIVPLITEVNGPINVMQCCREAETLVSQDQSHCRAKPNQFRAVLCVIYMFTGMYLILVFAILSLKLPSLCLEYLDYFKDLSKENYSVFSTTENGINFS